MFSLEIECPPGQQDLLAAELWEQGSAGITELDNGRLRAFFEDDADPERLRKRFQAVSWRREEPRDWVALSRANWEPLLVGARFFLLPEWRSDPAPEGRLTIVVNPGMAFGTGVHETTQLCLETMETYVHPGMSVLDVGTGSGILARAARLLGAAPVWACDIDPEAAAIAHRRAGPRVFAGSADAVRSGCADLICANISAEAIARLAPEWLRCLRPGGVVLASGFEGHELAAVERAFVQHGGAVREARHKRSWALAAISVTWPFRP